MSQDAMPVPKLLDGKPEKVAEGFQFTEGPVWSPEGFLLFSDIPAGKQYKWTAPGKCDVWREPSGHSNGLTFDLQGRLLACEHGNRRVARIDADKNAVTVVDRYQGKRLNSPNDIVVRSGGTIFFTDPPYGVKPPDTRDLDYQGVFAVRPDGEVKLLVADFDRPNGLCFSPDEKILYINDTQARVVRAFDCAADATLTNDRVFARADSPDKGGPDGMKCDAEGNIWTTGPGGVWVFAAGGEFLGRVVLPEQPANLAFGGADAKTLFFTARTGLYRARVKVPGLGPAFRK